MADQEKDPSDVSFFKILQIAERLLESTCRRNRVIVLGGVGFPPNRPELAGMRRVLSQKRFDRRTEVAEIFSVIVREGRIPVSFGAAVLDQDLLAKTLGGVADKPTTLLMQIRMRRHE